MAPDLVRPGDRISADGEIIAGESAIDESPVSGESIPVRKGVGDSVFAGTVNGEAATSRCYLLVVRKVANGNLLTGSAGS